MEAGPDQGPHPDQTEDTAQEMTESPPPSEMTGAGQDATEHTHP